MSQLTEFISCIPVVNEEQNEEDERGLCKIQIEDGAMLETLDENSLSGLRIEKMLVSEGTGIFPKAVLESMICESLREKISMKSLRNMCGMNYSKC